MRTSLVIVSNRLPIVVKKVDGKLEYHQGPGGLSVGMSAYVKDKRNKWVGWPGIPSDDLTEAEERQISAELQKSNCYPVFFTQKQLDDFYNGYSNSLLWPAFHDLPISPEQIAQHAHYWKAYRAINIGFADAVLALSDLDSTIWVHDYHLLLLPALLRAARPKAKVGFFLHIPFPAVKNFDQIPSAKQLLLGILGADLVGLHTKAYTKNFFDACAELTHEIVLPGQVAQVIQGTHTARITDFPMGIDYDRFTKARELPAVKKELRRHQRKYKGMKVILTVDRIDPAKGIVERLEAYHEFLRRTPAIHNKVVMAMLAQPSRTEIEVYQKLKERVEALVDKINVEFGTAKWQPVDYMPISIPVESVTALYQVADIAFITPLRDGMNLVAKEYVASKPKGDGVLILSSTAGAAQELTEALMVNPKRPETLVNALTKAVKMPKHELKRRIMTMNDQISTHTVQKWSGNFMKSLQKPMQSTGHITRTLTRERANDLADSFYRAQRPLVLLDYDGVLSPFTDNPGDAKPSRSLYNLLKKLAEHPGAELAIISGRSSDDLAEWFGDLPIHLVAEHGALKRAAGHKNWKRMITPPPTWQDELFPMLDKYAALTPGAFIETKNYALVWHYRKAAPYYAQKHVVILKRLLKPLAAARGLEIHSGNKILEIKPAGLTKGMSALGFMATNPDFILAIGDDYTDEDMFEALPPWAHTIKVGRGRTEARYRLQSVDQVLGLIKKLAR